MKTNPLLFRALLLHCLAATSHAWAATAVGPQTLHMRATVEEVPIDCSVGFSGVSGDSASFGSVTPAQIRSAPSGASASMDSVFAYSNFNGVYDGRRPMAVLRISCASLSPPDATAFRVQYGVAAQGVPLPPSGITGYRLDGGPNLSLLAFGVWARDLNSSNPGRVNQYAIPGSTVPLFADSFTPDAGRFSTTIEIFPALYWINPANTNSAPGTITTSVNFVITIL
jgi:type 1 fimbria pilin